MALTSDLGKVQNKKFQRDGIQDSSTAAFMDHHNQSSNTTKKTRSRRFKRRNTITANNRDNADASSAGIQSQLTTETMLTYARF